MSENKLKEYIIEWNAGYGDTHEKVEAENEKQAMEYAYERWKEEAESNAEYRVVGKYTEELGEDYGV